MGYWYKRMFEGNLGEYWLYVSDQRKTATEVSFLEDVLKKGLVLDLCCGPGRIAIPFSAYTPVVGLDLNMYLLKVARERAKQANAHNLDLIRGDMRYLPLKSEVFDGVISIWTSFGYFSQEENEIALKEISKVLKSEGIFLLETQNPGWLLTVFREKDWMEYEEFLLLEQRSIDWKSKRGKNRWIFVNKRTKEIDEISFDYRLYSLKELEELLSREGLGTTQVYGSFRGDDFDEAKSGRILILARSASLM